MTTKPIESWSWNNRYQFIISDESGSLIISEHIDPEHARVTLLSAEETLDLLQLLKTSEKYIRGFIDKERPMTEAEKARHWRLQNGLA